MNQAAILTNKIQQNTINNITYQHYSLRFHLCLVNCYFKNISKKNQNQRKNNFTLVKNISVIQSLSVSWCSGSLIEMEIQIYFQIR